MWNTYGRPGTPFSLVMKMLQAIFSFASFKVLKATIRIIELQVFGYMITATLFGAICSLVMVCFHLFLMIRNAQLDRVHLTFLIVGDFIVAYAQALSTMLVIAPTLHFVIDTKRCSVMYPKDCKLVLLAIGLAMAAWFCGLTSFVFALRHRISRGVTKETISCKLINFKDSSKFSET